VLKIDGLGLGLATCITVKPFHILPGFTMHVGLLIDLNVCLKHQVNNALLISRNDYMTFNIRVGYYDTKTQGSILSAISLLEEKNGLNLTIS